MRRATTSLAVTLALFSLRCGIEEEAGLEREATVGGPTSQATNYFPAVGYLANRDGALTCSGTYVGQHRVLTAAHCSSWEPRSFVFSRKVVDAQGREKMADYTVEVARFIVPRQRFELGPDELSDQWDLAIAVLKDHPKLRDLPPMPLAEDVPLPGSQVKILGYGYSGGLGICNRATEMAVKRSGLATFSGDMDFDSRDGSMYTMFFYDTDASSAHVCVGDSGGPSLFWNNRAAETAYGKWQLIGVHSMYWYEKLNDCQHRIDTWFDAPVLKGFETGDWVQDPDGLVKSAACPLQQWHVYLDEIQVDLARWTTQFSRSDTGIFISCEGWGSNEVDAKPAGEDGMVDWYSEPYSTLTTWQDLVDEGEATQEASCAVKVKKATGAVTTIATFKAAFPDTLMDVRDSLGQQIAITDFTYQSDDHLQLIVEVKLTAIASIPAADPPAGLPAECRPID